MHDRISVITPTIAPRAKLLRRAIFSVHNQTYPAAAHAIAYDLNHDGAPATRQRALDMVTPDCNWVAPLDDDDEFKPQHLDHLLRHALETGADFVYSWFELHGMDGRNWGSFDPVFPSTHYTDPFDPLNPVETTITVLVRRELAQEVGYQELRRGEDNTGEDFNFLVNCLALGGKVSHLVERTWVWNHHVGPDGKMANTGGRGNRW